MKYQKIALASLLFLLLTAASAAAQSPRQRPRPKAATPAAPQPAPKQIVPTRTAAAAAATPPTGTLAAVDGQPITLADLNPKVREVVEGLDRNMGELRRDALDARISTLLIESEAQKRKVTAEQLVAAEVNGRVATPTEAEIKAVYDANRSQIGNADISAVRPQIIEYLRSQSGQKLASDLITRLRASHAVVMGKVDVNAPNLAPTSVLATVDGQPIIARDFEERLKPYVYKLRYEIYQAEMQAITAKVNDLLLIAEAKRRGKTPEEVLRTEIADKVTQPAEAEVTKFYQENKARIPGDLNSVRADIINILKDQQQNRLEAEFAQRLRSTARLQFFLTEPEPPVQAISTDDDPSRGAESAPVTVVVFTDFQCPACSAAHPMIDQVMKSYEGRARLVIRDFPLAQHAQARKAAEAAAAAAAQGKFFEYIAVLFKNQSALDVPSLKKYATDLGLDRTRFDAALDSGQYAAEVSHDVADGEVYGVEQTPSIFINGVRLRNLSAEGMRAAIDRALAQPASSPRTAPAPKRTTK
ncbi:MAG TPA: thioredoxin domain-containing protein [Pyrinomonadaceae bacterium]|jgi:protein-disulfide isomerase